MESKTSTAKTIHAKRKSNAQSLPSMTEQREELLYMIARYGYVSTPQMAMRLFGGNKQNSQMADHSKKLFDAGYIDRFPLPSSSSTMRNMPLVSTLTKKGAELIANNRNISITNLCVPSASDLPKALYFEHLMMINDVRVIIELACEQQSYDLRWLDERTIRKNKLYGEVILQLGQEKGEKTATIPDGFFCIKANEGWFSFFLEIDRGTEKIMVIQKKAQVYLEYEKTSHYAQTYGATTQSGTTASLFALLITNSAKRRDNVAASLGKIFPSQPFLCAAYPELTPESVLNQPIWYAPPLAEATLLIV